MVERSTRSFRCLVLIAAGLLLADCAKNQNAGLPTFPASTITCADALGVGPDKEFTIGDPDLQVICINNICFQTPSSPVCFYGCGPDQQAAGMFSPCWVPTPTPSPTP
jgi:hypothetical protein